MFMVGVAIPFSIANRREAGQPFGKLFLHALWRGLALVLLGVFLSSSGNKQTDWNFVIVLSQIGLGYPLLWLLAWTQPRTDSSTSRASWLVIRAPCMPSSDDTICKLLPTR